MNSSETSPNPDPSSRRLKIVLPLLVLLLGAGATAALIQSRKSPEPVSRPVLGPLVETLVAPDAEDVRVRVRGQGEIQPRIRVDLLPEVAGRAVNVSPHLVVGGRFRAGETLVEIDRRDYELAVERARAAVARAGVALERESAEGEAATAEWRALRGEEEPPSLLVRKPQIRQAEAEVKAAEADLAAAELALSRTRLSVPFDGLVIQENVDPGQWVGQGRSLATVIGTEAVEVRIPLDDRELAWLDFPTPAEVIVDFAGTESRRQGTAERLEGRVDPRSRMVHVVVRIDRPFDETDGAPSLLPGTFARVALEGKMLENVVVVPRSALRAGDVVWVVRDGKLRMRTVEVARRVEDLAFLRADVGVEPGDRVVISSLEAVTDGMEVRLLEELSGDRSAEDRSAKDRSAKDRSVEEPGA